MGIMLSLRRSRSLREMLQKGLPGPPRQERLQRDQRQRLRLQGPQPNQTPCALTSSQRHQQRSSVSKQTCHRQTTTTSTIVQNQKRKIPEPTDPRSEDDLADQQLV